MERCVSAEWLDELPADDSNAIGSRRDLVRLNGWMGNASTLVNVLRTAFPGHPPASIVELGAGDGRFLLRVARQLGGWHGTRAWLLDRQEIVSPETRDGFAALDWNIAVIKADVFDWLGRAETPFCEAILANLFLHHFSETSLQELLAQAARRTRAFAAIEPRRSALALAGSRLVGLLGCNRVTRHDAPASVMAGFSGNDLSRLWPADGPWRLRERAVGWFGHLFVAVKEPSR